MGDDWELVFPCILTSRTGNARQADIQEPIDVAKGSSGRLSRDEVLRRNGGQWTYRGRIVLTPVRIHRADAVRAKLADLGITEADVADAVAWAREGVENTR